ncbi:hypothetical protein HS125_07350 [bacterium]|nr:hypothetical protein [bacterium]
MATSGFTATEHLPASLSLKAATSPFELRMFAGIGPFYRYDIHSEGKVVFWDNYFHNSMDSDEGPNYVDEAFARQAIPRWEKYCKVVSDLGGNAIMLGDAIHLVTFDRLVPGDPFAIYPKDSLYRARHLYHRRYFTELIAIAKKYGLDFYVYTDEFMYTPPLGDWIGRISADNPRLWQAYQAQFDEMLTEMPEIAGVVVRLGELYPTKGYLARGIADSRGHDPTNYRKLIEKTWEVVCKKHKKTYVHRTWSLGHDSLTGQAYLYDRIWNGMPTEGVIVSVKHTQTDFWYYNPVNPCLGVGRHKQIIEVQTRREYHAMGVWPDCPWQDYQQAYRLMARLPQAAATGSGPTRAAAQRRGQPPQTHYSYLKGSSRLERGQYLPGQRAGARSERGAARRPAQVGRGDLWSRCRRCDYGDPHARPAHGLSRALHQRLREGQRRWPAAAYPLVCPDSWGLIPTGWSPCPAPSRAWRWRATRGMNWRCRSSRNLSGCQGQGRRPAAGGRHAGLAGARRGVLPPDARLA